MKMVIRIDLSYTTKGEGGLNREGGLINFPPLKRGGGLLERGGLFELGGLIGDLQYAEFDCTALLTML